MDRMLWPSTIVFICLLPSFSAFGASVLIGLWTRNYNMWMAVGYVQFVVVFGAVAWFTRSSGAYYTRWLAHIRGPGKGEP